MKTVAEFVFENGVEALAGKQIKQQDGGKVLYAHSKSIENEKEFQPAGEKVYRNFRLYGGETQDAEMVVFIYANDFVIE